MGRVSTSSPTRDAQRRRPGETVLDAVLERITYANEETGYTIARVATDRSGADLLTVVGALLGVQPGETLRLVGRWGSHPKYGRQFEVDSFTTVLPATIQGIERYLGSGSSGISGWTRCGGSRRSRGGWSRWRGWGRNARR
jgi:exodeoxyribonuclease V alpha subunit